MMSELEFTKWCLFTGCMTCLLLGMYVHHRGDDASPLFVVSIIFGALYFVLPREDDGDGTL